MEVSLRRSTRVPKVVEKLRSPSPASRRRRIHTALPDTNDGPAIETVTSTHAVGQPHEYGPSTAGLALTASQGSLLTEGRSPYDVDGGEDQFCGLPAYRAQQFGLGLVVIGLFISAILQASTGKSDAVLGVKAIAVVFLTYCAFYMRDGYLSRPSFVLWRITKGISLLYLCFTIFLIFQDVKDVRQFLGSSKLPERDYATDCHVLSLEGGNPIGPLTSCIFDEFVVAHVLGWFAKGTLFRSSQMCWLSGAWFEVIEVQLQHILPNFKECWWDHIIVDLYVCNLAGVLIALWLLKKINAKGYRWLGPYADDGITPLVDSDSIYLSPPTTHNHCQSSSFLGKLWRSYSPFALSKQEWEYFSVPRRLGGMVIFQLLTQVTDLNSFFIKATLYLNPSHPINLARLLIIYAVALPAVGELYRYLHEGPSLRHWGMNAWLFVAILGTEAAMCTRWWMTGGDDGDVMHSAPHPPDVVFFTLLSTCMFVVWTLCYYQRRSDAHRLAPDRVQPALYSIDSSIPLNCLFYGSFLSLFILTVVATPRVISNENRLQINTHLLSMFPLLSMFGAGHSSDASY